MLLDTNSDDGGASHLQFTDDDGIIDGDNGIVMLLFSFLFSTQQVEQKFQHI